MAKTVLLALSLWQRVGAEVGEAAVPAQTQITMEKMEGLEEEEEVAWAGAAPGDQHSLLMLLLGFPLGHHNISLAMLAGEGTVRVAAVATVGAVEVEQVNNKYFKLYLCTLVMHASICTHFKLYTFTHSSNHSSERRLSFPETI